MSLNSFLIRLPYYRQNWYCDAITRLAAMRWQLHSNDTAMPPYNSVHNQEIFNENFTTQTTGTHNTISVCKLPSPYWINRKTKVKPCIRKNGKQRLTPLKKKINLTDDVLKIWVKGINIRESPTDKGRSICSPMTHQLLFPLIDHPPAGWDWL